ncbi:uncharacterized protein LOC114132032 [Aphis gossypii]|uniref:uncharacterized protein LOC114132032 n=1 Tax=Aphis gossypii TaxID=80765 RepID=UPI002159B40E|nr:uncharacterized protein LOC114132032 [Aphis gossypii]
MTPESLRLCFGVTGFYRVLFSVPDVPVPGSRVLGSVRDVFSAFVLPLARGKIVIAGNMYRRHESLISQVTKTADDVPVIVTRLASTEKNDIDYYPFSQVLRIRVLQIVCGILAVVMGSVACIEEKGSFGNLGLGIPTGLSTVLAAASSIHTSRLFSGYRDTLMSSSGHPRVSVLRLLGPTTQSAIAVGTFWLLALALNAVLFTRAGRTLLNYDSSTTSSTLFWMAIVHLTLTSLVLLAVGAIAWLDCHHDPD